MKAQRYTISFTIILLASSILSACTGVTARAAVSEDYVRDLAETKMLALNEGDHSVFVQDFNDILKEAFGEEEFMDFREAVLGSSGRFESITGSRIASPQTGYVSYIYSCKFENETVTLTLNYEVDGEQVEGIFFNGPRLVRALQSSD